MVEIVIVLSIRVCMMKPITAAEGGGTSSEVSNCKNICCAFSSSYRHGVKANSLVRSSEDSRFESLGQTSSGSAR